MRILLIEDELNIVSFIKKGLEELHFDLEVAFNGHSGIEMALNNEYDVIILDLVLPGINGLELCKTLREKGVSTRILMLTALGTLDDVVSGFDAGADDYLKKPFRFPELVARLRVLFRSQNHVNSSEPIILRISDLELDTKTKSIKRQGIPIKLTVSEYYLLDYFFCNQGRVLSRIDIAEKIWGEFYPDLSNVDSLVSRLRNKIDKEFEEKLIHTVIGMGYVLKESRE